MLWWVAIIEELLVLDIQLLLLKGTDYEGFREIIVYVILQKSIIVKVKAEAIFLQEQWAFAVDALK